MTVELYDNITSPGTSTMLTAPCSATDTVIQVRGPASATLQQPGGQFRIIVVDPTNGNEELMLVIGGAWSATWRVQRGVEGTTPLPFTASSLVRHTLTAASLLALAGVSGPGGGSGQPGPPGNISQTTQTGTTYTFTLDDVGTLIDSTNAAPVTFTIPLHSDVPFGIGDTIQVRQYGAGPVTIAAPGVTLRSPSTFTTRAQYATVTLIQRTINEWILSGDMASGTVRVVSLILNASSTTQASVIISFGAKPFITLAASSTAQVIATISAVTSVPAKFFQTNYGSFPTGTAQDPPYAILNIQSNRSAQVAPYKAAHPNTLILLYQDMLMVKPSDPTGITALAVYNSTPTAQMLLDTNGKPMQVTYGPGFLLDPGNTALQAAGVAHSTSLVAAAGADGIFIDNLIPQAGGNQLGVFLAQLSATLSTTTAITSLPCTATTVPFVSGQALKTVSGTHVQVWTTTAAVAQGATSIPVISQIPNFAYPSGTNVFYNYTGYTNTTWQAAQYSYLAALKAAHNTNGNIILPNITYWTPDQSYWDNCIDNADGGWFEEWSDGTLGINQQISFMPHYLDYGTYPEAHGKWFGVHSQNRTQGGGEHGMALMLLTAGVRSVYSTNANQTVGSEQWYPEWATAQTLGAPAGPYSILASGLYFRQFQNGRVIVNITANAITDNALPGTGPNGSSITLAGVSWSTSVSATIPAGQHSARIGY